MGSLKRQMASSMLDSEESKMDMSSMIDMVFLLLIFFMVNSRIIKIKQDPDVIMPIASESIVPKDTRGRIVINLWGDGTIHDNISFKEIQLSDVTTLSSKLKNKCDSKGIDAYLHLRADKKIKLKHMKDVVKAAAEGGISSIIFGTYQQEK